jgi:hypothetical protein
MTYYTIWFLQFQNLIFGYTIFYPSANHEGQGWSALKTTQLSGRACATSKKVWSWSVKKYSKIRFLSVLWLGPILTLTFDFDPYDLIWWLLTPRYSYMLTIMSLRWKTKKSLNFCGNVSFYFKTSLNHIIKSKFLLISKAFIKCFHIRYHMIWYRRFQNFNFG